MSLKTDRIITTSVSETSIEWDVVPNPETGAYDVVRTTTEVINPGMSKAGAEWFLDAILQGRAKVRGLAR